MSNGGDCRTAPATPGLLHISCQGTFNIIIMHVKLILVMLVLSEVVVFVKIKKKLLPNFCITIPNYKLLSFHQLGPLGRVGLVVVMSVYLPVCVCVVLRHHVQFFSRPLIGPQVS